MALNLSLIASNGVDTREFVLITTPTDVSESIIGSANPVVAYKKWVSENFSNQMMDILDFDGELTEDLEYPVIGQVSIAGEHIARLNSFIAANIADGFKVSFEFN